MKDIKNQDEFYEALQNLDDRFDMMEPELAVTVSDEDMEVEGYVVVWNTGISADGPLTLMGKGGTRVTPATDLDEIKMLARIMALKNAAAGLPLGGAKSGLKADSRGPDIEEKYKRFVTLCKPYLHENGGVFGGFGYDIGARPEMAHWACEALGSGKSFTGKPLELGGTDYDVEGIAGLGVAVAGKTAAKFKDMKIDNTTFAVQGVGAMGAAVIRYFSEYGGKLSAVSDPRLGGSWFFKDHAPPDGFVEAISKGEIEAAKNILINSPHHETRPDSADVLFADVNILFPCAIQEVIHDNNADQIKAHIVCEGANNPVTDMARTLLDDRGICVIPDFIANPGGVIAAFVEMTSDISVEENLCTRGKVQMAKDMTVERITENVTAMLKLADMYQIRPCDAGRYMALSKIFE